MPSERYGRYLQRRDPSADSQSVAREAHRLMDELNVPVIPTNFTVWFAYVLGRSAALRKTIDVMRSNKRPFEKAVNRELYRTFLNSNSLAHAGQSIVEELGAVLLNVRGDLSDAAAQNRAQADGLSEVGDSLRQNRVPLAALARLGEELAQATKRASALEAKLIDASNEVEQLRADLEQTETRSKTDALTGLANRRALESFLRAAQIKSMEHGEPLSVLLADIDHFKRFNDQHGHQLGDQVLRIVAKCLEEGIRAGDCAHDTAARS